MSHDFGRDAGILKSAALTPPDTELASQHQHLARTQPGPLAGLKPGQSRSSAVFHKQAPPEMRLIGTASVTFQAGHQPSIVDSDHLSAYVSTVDLRKSVRSLQSAKSHMTETLAGVGGLRSHDVGNLAANGGGQATSRASPQTQQPATSR